MSAFLMWFELLWEYHIHQALYHFLQKLIHGGLQEAESNKARIVAEISWSYPSLETLLPDGLIVIFLKKSNLFISVSMSQVIDIHNNVL